MSIDNDTYARSDATALAALVRDGSVTPLELVDAAIERCEAINGTLNAVITTMFDAARDAAREPPGDGPFAGVPFLMKDFVAEVAGVPFSEGSAFLDGYVPAVDSEIVRRLRDAGLITIGKTNLPEFAIGVTTEPRRFGPTRNPWDPSRTPGGSSGGAGAAVAARIVPAAHGNDVGGSIRIPASCCGLFGLKPTRGRTTLAPHYGDLIAGYFTEHVLTRTVRDSAALLDVVAGAAPGEPYVAPPPARPFRDECGAPPGRLRIGFSDVTPLGDPLDPACIAAVRETAARCAALGHDVEEAAPDFEAFEFWTAYTTVLASGVAWALADWSRRLDKPLEADVFEPFVWAFAERGRAVDAPDFLLAIQDVQHHARAIGEFYERFDVWLTPTLGEPPVSLGTLVYDGDPFELRRRTARFSPYTFIANATGQPAMSVPLAQSADGLPIGLHFTARLGEEALLIRLAAQLEAAHPWHEDAPPLAGSFR